MDGAELNRCSAADGVNQLQPKHAGGWGVGRRGEVAASRRLHAHEVLASAVFKAASLMLPYVWPLAALEQKHAVRLEVHVQQATPT